MAVPFADSKFFELVFLNSVCGLELCDVSAVSQLETTWTYFFIACLVLKACSLLVAGDMISSEGETYCTFLHTFSHAHHIVIQGALTAHCCHATAGPGGGIRGS